MDNKINYLPYILAVSICLISCTSESDTIAKFEINNSYESIQYEYQEDTFKNVDGLKVSKQYTDHSFYIRYEVPGWESDNVDYRFYLDRRNVVHVFEKETTKMVLQNVGQDGFDSYHKEADWGMAIVYKTKQLQKRTQGTNSHIVVLTPANNELNYAFAAT